ncbi:DUF4214 domain-containing protein [Prochlorococcus marinus]|uniref:DUF4214 domain-containing protein n=1 Tax=Prochlorococcus marinus TaxID=1219 RepID=UPI0022B3A600|nr:DUF4214 domain-containing protein [Prochlorococcus marinus]
MANATSTQLQELYVAYFGRAADPTGLDYWTEKGISTATFAADMYVQAEFKDAYGSLSTESQVNQIYKNLFDREADVAGLTYWTQQINLGNLKLAEIANDLIWAAQNNAGSADDKTALANRTNAAVAYTAKVKETVGGILAYQAESTSPWVSGDNIKEAVSYMSGIDKSTASTAAGIAASVAKIVATGVPTASTTFKLTSNIDNKTGGAGRDIFQGTDSTLQANDVLVGGDGVDTLEYVDSSTTGTAMPGVSLSDIEKISVRNLSGNAATAASTETAAVEFKTLAGYEKLTLAGLTFTAGSQGATPTQLATAFSGGVSIASNAGGAVGAVLSGTISGYTAASGGTVTSTKFTADSTGNKTDLAATGTGSSATEQVTVLTFATNAANADNRVTLDLDGTTVSSAAAGNANVTGLKNMVSSITDQMNSVAGSKVAYLDSSELVVVVRGKTVGSFVMAGTTPATTMSAKLASTKSTHTLGTVPASTASDTSAVYLNGEVLSTGTLSANTEEAAGAALVTSINNHIGRTVASFAADTDIITVDGEGQAIHLSRFSVGNTVTSTSATTTSSLGSSVSAAPTITVTQGSAAVTANSTTTNTQTVDTSLWTGVDEYKNFASTNPVKFTGVAENDKLVVASVAGGTGATTDIQYAAAVVKGADTVGTLELSSSSNAGTITIGDSSGTGIETLNITATGTNKVSSIVSKAAKTVTLDASGATDVTISSDVASKGTLTITGAGKVTLNTLDTAFDTVDASGSTGGVVVTDVDASETVYTLSSGDDKFTTAADGFATADKFAVAAGDGTDTLVVTAAADLDTSAEADRYTGFETLSVSDSQDVSLIAGITGLEMAADTSGVLSGVNSTAAENITVTGSQATAFTVTLTNATGSADVVTLDLKSATSTTNVDIAGLSVVGVETLNVKGSTGTAATDSDVAFASGGATTLKAVNFSGTADMTISGANTAKAITFNSTTTGDVTVSGAFIKASTLTTGGGKDLVTVSTNMGSTYNTGAGDDTITAAFAKLVATGSDDHVIDAGAGTDTIRISDSGAVTLIDNHFTNITNAEKLLTVGTGNLSVTTGAAVKTAYSDSLTFTSGTLADNSTITWAGGLYTKDQTLTFSGASLVFGAASEDISITTGAGNDTVKTGTASNLIGIGSANAGSTMTISTGAGNDTIEFGYGTLVQQSSGRIATITGGKGVDSIKKTSGTNGEIHDVNVTSFVFADGDSVVGAYDTITGYQAAGSGTNHHGDILDVGTGATVGTSIGSTDFGTLKSHSLTNGEVSFDDVSTYSAAVVINSSNLSDATGYLNANLETDTTVTFEYDSTGNGSADSTFVYTNLAATASSADTLILLKSTTGVGLFADTNSVTANQIIID